MSPPNPPAPTLRLQRGIPHELLPAMRPLLALARNLAPADLAMKGEKWDRKSFAGVELFGKRLGVIGLGRIGRDQLEDYARRKGMDVETMARWLAPNLDDAVAAPA